jgi:hypothetical protein
MVKRLVLGLVVGLLVGGVVAFALLRGLGVPDFALGAGGALLAYASAAATGALTGLVAGKPIWSKGGQIEAGLKAIVGALVAAGGMFALRQWVHVDVALPDALTNLGANPAIHDVHGALGALPFTALPLIAGVLGAFFGLDNTDGPAEPSKSKGVRVATAGNGKSRVATDDAADEDEDVPPPKKAKR